MSLKFTLFSLTLILILCGCQNNDQKDRTRYSSIDFNPIFSPNRNYAFLNKNCRPDGHGAPSGNTISDFMKNATKIEKTEFSYDCEGIIELKRNEIKELKESISLNLNPSKACPNLLFDGAYFQDEKLYLVGTEYNERVNYQICLQTNKGWLGKPLSSAELNAYFKIFPKDYFERRKIGFLKRFTDAEFEKEKLKFTVNYN